MQNLIPGQRPETDAGYLEMMTAVMFMGGLSRQVVMSKWDGFLAAFEQFDVATVADFTDVDVERLSQDARIVRYKAKIRAVVDNARQMQQIAAAERPDVSAAKLNKARSMALLEQTGIEYGIMYDNAISTAISVIDDVLKGITSGASTEQLLRSMTGQPSWQQMMRTRAMSRGISGYD